jgi:hypothetical protein
LPFISLVSVFVKHHDPWIRDRHVEHDERSVLATLEQTRDLNRFALPQRHHLAKLFAVSKGDDLQRYGKVHIRLHHQRAEYCPHLLEANRDILPAALAGIGDDRKMGRLDFDPLRFTRRSGD